jgi:hypothetical protein
MKKQIIKDTEYHLVFYFDSENKKACFEFPSENKEVRMSVLDALNFFEMKEHLVSPRGQSYSVDREYWGDLLVDNEEIITIIELLKRHL